MNLSNIRRQAINDANGLTLKKGKQIMYKYGLGLSSKAILGRHLGETNHHCDYPHDNSDFMRCIGIVRVMKIDINVMKDTSYIWNRILKQWDTLIELAMKEDFSQVAYLLQEQIQLPKTSLEHIQEVNFIMSINRLEGKQCDTAIKITKLKR